MSKYSITLQMDQKECFNDKNGHICPMATKLPAGVYCGATNCMGQKKDLMQNCPIEKVPEAPKRLYHKRNYITCSDCGIQYHEHLTECPECGFIE